jgi:hypothetical protein
VNLKSFIPTAVGVLALTGCEQVKDAVSTTPQFGVVALLDISASTDQAALKQRYQKELLAIIDQVAPRGAIVRADAIRATPLAETIFPVRIDVAKMSVIDKNEFNMEEAVTNAKASAVQELTQLLSENPATPFTRILDAVEVTSRIFNGYEMKGIPDRRLVIFSDMIESSDRYEFTRAGLSQRAISAMIQKDKRAGRIPNLSGVSVWIAGAGAGGGARLSSEQLRAIENFWMDYFRAAGADLAPTRYGSTLLNFAVARYGPRLGVETTTFPIQRFQSLGSLVLRPFYFRQPVDFLAKQLGENP